jgi:hypothetical protein
MEASMTSIDAYSAPRSRCPSGTVDMNLEVATLPVSNVDRAKGFYQNWYGG